MADAAAITLPQGGGALKGVGESFAADPHTGSGGFTVPLAVPPGRNGVQPDLELTYSTGNGNGAFGLGWALSVPAVSRKTDRGVPRFDDTGDTFLLPGGEDLTPVHTEPGVVRYQPRTEGTYARILHRRDADTDIWEVHSRDGMSSVYGTPGAAGTDDAVVADPTRRSAVFSWMLTSTVDPFGNRIEYSYERDFAPARFDQLYLKQVRYGDYTHPDTGSREFLVSVTFDYDAVDRPDCFSTNRAGFEIRTRRRCRRIVVATHADMERTARTYTLRYVDERVTAGELSADALAPNGVSLLSQIQVVGHDGAQTEAMPPLEFSYTRFDARRRDFRPLTGQLPLRSLASPDVALVDLFGDGLPDLLETSGTMRYWRNLGNCRFDSPRVMSDAPAGLRLSSPGVQLMDADGDGRVDLLVDTPGLSGYFPLRLSGGWDRGSFQTYAQAPSFTLDDPEVHLVDLDGDGVTDAVRSGARFEYYFNDRHDGWTTTARTERKSLDEFPNVNFSDHRVRWADMCGDGLEDVVYLHRGNVAYWPNLGRGRWGRRVQMPAAPGFPPTYDPKRVLFGDVDGDGVADLLYVDHQRVLLWINRSGNSWSDPIEITGTPGVALGEEIRLVDLLGTGTAGVLWTRDPRGAGDDYGFFLDLTGGVKPYLLTEVDNHMGALTRIGYASSTEFYLRDHPNPRTRWRTSLPFPVPVVARVQVVDGISHGKLTTEYSYRHGCFDGGDREFRGFAFVEQTDTQTFDDYHQADGPAFNPVPPQYFSPPSHTRMWFHVGPVGDEFGEWSELDFSDEYWPGDQGLLGHTDAVNAFLRSYPQTATSRRIKRDALRALRGSLLRTESYTLDGTALQHRPESVTESAYGLREDSPPPAGVLRPRIFFPHIVAERSTEWERGDDPLSQFTFVDDYDEFGQPRRHTEVSPPRRSSRRRTVTGAVVGDVQPNPTEVQAILTRTQYAEPDDDAVHIRDRVSAQSTFELAAPVSVAETDPNDVQQVLRDQYDVARLIETTLAGDPPSVRLVHHETHYYDGPAFVGLPLGWVGSFGALTRVAALAMTDDELDTALGAHRPNFMDGGGALPAGAPAGFGADLGYRREIGADGVRRYYIDGDRKRFDFQSPGGSARGLVTATREARGGQTTMTFDRYQILPIQVTDPVGLQTSATYDYRALQAKQVVDANGNVAEYGYSPLGGLHRVWARGHPTRNEGDETAPSVVATADYFAYERDGEPICLRTVRRMFHDTDTTVPVAQRDATSESREYCDGFGRVIQIRSQADDVIFGAAGDDVGLGPTAGTATGQAIGVASNDRVVVSGWTVFNNKGEPVQAFEPFFDSGWAYRADAALGSATTTYYDGRGRAVRTVHPDGSEARTVFGIPDDLAVPGEYSPTPWEVYWYDPNDLAALSFGGDGASLADRAPASHHATPSSTIVDAGTRVICRITRNGPDPDTDWQITRARYDSGDNLLTLTDPLGRQAFRAVYDLPGDALLIDSNDAGARITIRNADGEPVFYRDSAGRMTLRAFDAADRLVRCWGRDDDVSPLTLREWIIYGDEGDVAANRALNRLGQPARHYDEAGAVEFERYDFKGTPVVVVRQAVKDSLLDADWAPDWSAADPNAALDAQQYRTDIRVDAVDRVHEYLYPADHLGHRARLTPRYNRSGLLERVELDGAAFVDRIAYNAKGQRVLIAYGNGILTRYGYDHRTWRLCRLHTQHSTATPTATYTPNGAVLQDIGYGHDLVGNVVAISDRAPGSGVPASALGADALDRRFSYDPLYRLVAATGRECELAPANPVGVHQPRPADPTLSRPYEETFGYDHADNLIELVHTQIALDGTRQTRRRRFGVAAGSNRMGTLDAAGASLPYGYDQCGQLMAETDSRSYAWDHAGRMTGFTVRAGAGPPSLRARYLYGPSGQRVKKLVAKAGGNDTTVYINGVFEHRRIGGVEQCLLHIMDDVRRIAVVRVGAALPDDGAADMPVQYHLGDHLNSSSVVIGGAAATDSALVRREEYTAYGETSFGSFGRKRYRYTAKECDEESGLYYVGERYYAPWLSRWISCDPSGLAGGTNLYVFGENNPLTLRDDDGAAPKLPPGARVHVFQQKGKDAQGHQVEGYSKVIRSPGGKPAAASAGNSAGTHHARGSPATKPSTGHGNDAATVPGSKTGVTGGTAGGTGTERGTTTGGAGGPGDGGTGGSPQGTSATGSPQGSPTGSATSNGGSPNGITDTDRHKKSSGEGGTGITGKGSGSLSQMDLAVLIARTASDPLEAAVEGATEEPQAGKSGGLPEGSSKDAAGNEVVQGLYVAAKAVKAALFVAVAAVGATAKGGAQAIKIGSGRAYSVLHQVRLNPTGKISKLPKKLQRLIHWSRAQRALNKEMKNNPVLKKAVIQARAKGQWVWHHSSQEGGLMELVPAVQHRASILQDLFHPYVMNGRRVGGFFLWGDLYN